MTEDKPKPTMKWRVVMFNWPIHAPAPRLELENNPDYSSYVVEKYILGAIQGAKDKMETMDQFKGWADDKDDEDGYYHGGPPYSTTDDPDRAMFESEHTEIDVEEIN